MTAMLKLPQKARGQLCKSHGAELFRATEAAPPAIALITSHTVGKRSLGKEVHQLRQHQLASVHYGLQR
jgi:hypothetical protein